VLLIVGAEDRTVPLGQYATPAEVLPFLAR
jgi:hypothetical protein